jgi:hypothetical protein
MDKCKKIGKTNAALPYLTLKLPALVGTALSCHLPIPQTVSFEDHGAMDDCLDRDWSIRLDSTCIHFTIILFDLLMHWVTCKITLTVTIAPSNTASTPT